MDNAVAVVLLTPIFYPVIEAMGGNLVYFGVLFIFALAIGQITPPVGLCLFVSCNIADESIERISIEIIPFVVVLIVILLILNFFSESHYFYSQYFRYIANCEGTRYEKRI